MRDIDRQVRLHGGDELNVKCNNRSLRASIAVNRTTEEHAR